MTRTHSGQTQSSAGLASSWTQARWNTLHTELTLLLCQLMVLGYLGQASQQMTSPSLWQIQQ